jgi:hypothetical protein
VRGLSPRRPTALDQRQIKLTLELRHRVGNRRLADEEGRSSMQGTLPLAHRKECARQMQIYRHDPASCSRQIYVFDTFYGSAECHAKILK